LKYGKTHCLAQDPEETNDRGSKPQLILTFLPPTVNSTTSFSASLFAIAHVLITVHARAARMRPPHFTP
jgi:hypothetical protein